MKKLLIFLLLVFQNVSFGQNQNVKIWNELKSELIHRTKIIDIIYNESSEDAYPQDREVMKKDNELLKKVLEKNKVNKHTIRQVYKANRSLNKSIDQVYTSFQLNMEIINKKALPVFENLSEVDKKINLLVKMYNLQCEKSNSNNLKFPLRKGESPTLMRL